MKLIFISLLLFTSSIVYGQKKDGIRFEHGKTWAQIKDQAKTENKYIFLDCYTLWCAPCRYMAQEIFTQSAVGAFFNKNFISVAVQFEKGKNDGPEVKQWYKDAELLGKIYKINLYPTYLFFKPDGQLVHTVYGGSKTAKEFMTKVKPALTPATQFATLKKQFDAGNRSPQFLLTLINATKQSNNQGFLPIVINVYLAKQQNLFTDENINLAVLATQKSTDPGFAMLKNNPERADAVVGNGKSASIVKDIAFNEIVLPGLRKNGKRTFSGPMITYQGILIKHVNWAAIKTSLDKSYPTLSDEILLAAKPVYYQWATDWRHYTEAVTAYKAAYKEKLPNTTLNNYAWEAYMLSADTSCLNAALTWSNHVLKSDDNKPRMWYLLTHASLLYKLGRKAEAIPEMRHLVDMTGDKDGTYFLTLEKMKAGERTW